MGYISLGCIGGLLPDVIRLLNWTQAAANNPSAMQRPSKVTVFLRLTGLLIQSGLGGFGVYLLGAASALQAVAIGFAGPEFLTRVLAAAVPKVPPPPPGAVPQAGMMGDPQADRRAGSLINAILAWWRS